VESGGLFAFNKLITHCTQTQTANIVDVRARQNTTSCSTVSKEKRTIAIHLERKMTRKSRAALKEKRNGEGSIAKKKCWTSCTERRHVTTNVENRRNPTIPRLNDLPYIIPMDFGLWTSMLIMSTSWLLFKLGPARSFLPIGNFVMRRYLCIALWCPSSIAAGTMTSSIFEGSIYCNISLTQGRTMPARVCCSKASSNMFIA
jgi:hypothetical protein